MQQTLLRRQRFKEYRQKYNLSQRQVALDLGVTEGHIRNIESGRGNPDAKLLFKLSRYFSAKPEDLFPDLADVEVVRPGTTSVIIINRHFK